MLQAARTGDPDFRLGELTAALQELIGVLQRLRSAGGGGPAEGLLGTARRAYELRGSLRLHGLCTTAVLADSGYAGVVTYVADRDGGLWMIADLMPGDARRAAKAGNATVALGETALSHRALTRAGLVVSGATASATRQLGAGKSVRAVTARGCGWHEEPLARLWTVPLGEQVHRAFEALALPVTDRRAGDDLVFLSVRIEGTGGDDAVHATASGGTPLTLRVADDSPALAYRENLRLLGHAAGLELLIVARPDPARPGTVFPLSVAPVDATDWNLPAAQGGHADLAFDRLHRSHLPQTAGLAALEDTTGASATPSGDLGDGPPAQAGPAEVTPGQAAPGGVAPGQGAAPLVPVASRAATTGDPVLRLLAAQVERTVSGGRTVHVRGGPGTVGRHPAAAGPARHRRGPARPVDGGGVHASPGHVRAARGRRRQRVRPGVAGHGGLHGRRDPRRGRGDLATGRRALSCHHRPTPPPPDATTARPQRTCTAARPHRAAPPPTARPASPHRSNAARTHHGAARPHHRTPVRTHDRTHRTASLPAASHDPTAPHRTARPHHCTASPPIAPQHRTVAGRAALPWRMGCGGAGAVAAVGRRGSVGGAVGVHHDEGNHVSKSLTEGPIRALLVTLLRTGPGCGRSGCRSRRFPVSASGSTCTR